MAGFGDVAKYALAGAAAGVGSGMVERAKAKREKAIEDLRWQRRQQAAGEEREWRSEEAGLDRGHRTSEREAGQEFKSGEAETERDWRSGEARIGREHETAEREAGQGWRTDEAGKARTEMGDRFQDDRGYWWQRNDQGEAAPVTDPDGKQIRGPVKSSGGALSAKDKRELELADAEYRKEVWESATSEDAPGRKTVDYDAVVSNLREAKLPITRQDRVRIKSGLQREIREKVEIEAEEREGIISNDYDGKPRRQWIDDEVKRRVDEELVNLGLAERRPGEGEAAAAAQRGAGGGMPEGRKESRESEPGTPAAVGRDLDTNPLSASEIDASYERAQEALRRGMPRETVERRLHAWGLDPARLAK